MPMYKKGGVRGFTIVELLIVVVIVAILAAITIVAYNGIQGRTYRSIVLGDLRGAWKKLELAKTDLGHYPQSLAEMPDGFGFTKTAYDQSQNDIYYCLDKPNDVYILGVRDKLIKGYFLASTGVVTENVTVNGASVCTVIGKTWVNDATTVTIMGYDGPSHTWLSTWYWTD